MKAPTAHYTAECAQALDSFRAYMEGELPPNAVAALKAHLQKCEVCRTEFQAQSRVLSLLKNTFTEKRISETFDHTTNRKILKAKETGEQNPAEFLSPELINGKESAFSLLSLRMSAAPWWGVSVALHVLVILLAGLISMSIELPRPEDSVVVVTELLQRQIIQEAEREKPQAKENALASKHETPPTDPTSKEQSDIVVPPDILAKAELGDHWETINPDRPDTQSAFGNPDSHMFYSEKGCDEPEGGGGTGGVSLDDVIGIGGASSPGTGGGWGGGHGTGIGVGNGSGRGSFGSRNGGGRKLMVKRHGGSPATEGAVERALEWLARNQEADGHWDAAKHGASMAGDTAMCGLACLAFLGAGHTEKIGKYKDNVQRAVKWLIAQQSAEGCVEKKGDNGRPGYNHPIGSLALAEAAGMARMPETIAAAQKAVDYSVEVFQQGKGSDRLGWRYHPQELGDISTTGWFVMQLKSAKVAGLKVDPLSFEGASRFLDTLLVEKPNKNDPYSGHRYGYRADQPGGGVRVKNPHCNTAIGCLARLFMGTKPDELRGAVDWFIDKGGVPKAEHPEFYHWYYSTLGIFQVGGDQWKRWNEGLKTALVSMQCKGGANDGSWDPKGHSTEGAEQAGGRVFTTAIGAMCLEVYYRYMKLTP